MNKARVLAQYTRQLRIIATITLVERPRLAKRLTAAHQALAELDRLTCLDASLVERLRREVVERLSRPKR